MAKKIDPHIENKIQGSTLVRKSDLTTLLMLFKDAPRSREAILPGDYIFLLQLRRQAGDGASFMISNHDKRKIDIIKAQSQSYLDSSEIRYFYQGEMLNREDYGNRLFHLSKTPFVECHDRERIREIQRRLPNGDLRHDCSAILGSEDILFIDSVKENLKTNVVRYERPGRRGFYF